MCEFENKCWRYFYTSFLRANPDFSGELPERYILIEQEFAPLSLLRGGMFCYNFPTDKGENFCPDSDFCPEFQKEKARQASNQRKKRFERQRERVNLSLTKRRAILEKYSWKCVYCYRYQGQKFNGKIVRLCVDHIKPIALGGSDDENNLVASCRDCNAAKSFHVEGWAFGCRKNFYKNDG